MTKQKVKLIELMQEEMEFYQTAYNDMRKIKGFHNSYMAGLYEGNIEGLKKALEIIEVQIEEGE